MTAACDGKPVDGADPAVPSQLVNHEEIPFGDAIMSRETRAEIAARDLLEPHYGPLKSRIYTLRRADRAAVEAGLPASLPPGWTPVAAKDFPGRKGALHAFANGQRMFAILLVETPSPQDDPIPAVVLRNFEGKR